MIEHDSDCERLPNFLLCHCAKRERLARGLTELPTLVVRMPLCGECWSEVWHDGNSLRCDRCHVVWLENPSDGDTAREFWDDYDEEGSTLDELRQSHIKKSPVRGRANE